MEQGGHEPRKWEASGRWKRLGNRLFSRAPRREHKRQTGKTEAESNSEVAVIFQAKVDGV